MLLHQIGLHLLVSNFVLVQINKVVHQVWKLLGSLDTTVCKEPTHMRLNHFSGHSSDWKLPSSIHAITTDGRSSIFGLWSGLNQQTMMVEFLRRLSALPSVSNVDSSGSADQTPSVRPSGCLTDWVQRVRPLHSHNEERSVRQRVRPLVDTPGEENAQIGTTVALVSNADVQSIPQAVPYFGMFVHCLTDHQGQSLTFTSERKSPGNRPKLVTKIGRSPWIVEVVEFLHTQSNKIRLWALPATASFECNCLKLDHPEKTEWRFLYQCMGRIMQDLYRDPSRIQNAYEFGCFGICCRQMEAFSNIFSETSRLSFCRFSCLTKTEVDTGFYDRIQRSSSTSFHEIFDNYFSSFGGIDIYIIAASRSLGLSQNRWLGDRWQPATIGGNCCSTFSGRIYSRTCDTYCWIYMFCSAAASFFFMLIFVLQILKMKLGYRLWHFSAVESQLPDPRWQNRLWSQSEIRELHGCSTNMPGWYVLLTLLGGVIGETCPHSLFWQCSWTRQKMGITIALEPSVTSGALNTIYVEFRIQRRQTNVFTNNAANPYNSESKMTPFRALHVAWPFRDDVCK